MCRRRPGDTYRWGSCTPLLEISPFKLLGSVVSRTEFWYRMMPGRPGRPQWSLGRPAHQRPLSLTSCSRLYGWAPALGGPQVFISWGFYASQVREDLPLTCALLCLLKTKPHTRRPGSPFRELPPRRALHHLGHHRRQVPRPTTPQEFGAWQNPFQGEWPGHWGTPGPHGPGGTPLQAAPRLGVRLVPGLLSPLGAFLDLPLRPP